MSNFIILAVFIFKKNNEIRNNTYGVSVSDETGYNNLLYFQYNEIQTNTAGYWIASPGAYNGNTVCHIYFNGFIPSSNNDSGKNTSTRPVIAIEK